MTHTLSRILYSGMVFFLILASCILIPAGALTITQSDSATSVSSSIANGDPVIIKGIATGHPQNGLQIWLIGNNYLKVTTASVNDDNTFSYELKKEDTLNLAGGQYYVVVQHPMMNGQFDVVYSPSTGEVTNRQLGNNGMTIFQISGSGSLQGPNGAQALIRAISSQNIDDTFTTFSFNVNPASALINPIGDHYVGDVFKIGGSTNLAAGDDLQVEITSSSFVPSTKSSDSSFSGTGKTVKVQAGTNGKNQWSLPVDTASFKPDEYMVKVSGITVAATDSATFRLLERPVATQTTTPFVTATTTLPPTATTTIPATTVPATKKSPLPIWTVIGAGLLATGILKIKKE